MYFKKHRNSLLLIAIILMICFVNSAYGDSYSKLLKDNSLKELDMQFRAMKPSQRELIIKALVKGEEHDLSLTLGAIIWHESFAGEYLINVMGENNLDCGVTQINTQGYLKRRNLTVNKWNTKKACQRLLFDSDLAIDEAISVLSYFNNYHKGNWKKMVKSYNVGFNLKNRVAEKYLKDISDKVKVLRYYFRR